ncbi:hypothetical protein GCM10023216_07130 [Isoptericola chiayiensis]|uniref:Sulfotransferase family protein n=1 Tax=Isoptericola chiayiensis TaxID=579446 RepID=A0ABP8Y5J2_9MICO|nr:hypothetical protein [Isoptericola chiayiensis]NOV99327.1 hypothetical protein [Isoptericola chiayiensis]
MTATSADGLLLPERARLLHIGLMKTGTTSLQNAASALRPELAARGVLYPGTAVNHRIAMAALMERSLPGVEPRPKVWKRLHSEIEADTSRRVLVGHEFVSEADDATAQQVYEGLGDRTHVVITLRNYSEVLPSAWQQTLKSGRNMSFGHWLKQVLSDDLEHRRLRLERDRLDQGAVTERWARVVGPENVTVVVVDKSTPTLLFDAFEDMLGLDRGVLAGADLDGFASNRSMSLEEAELLRAVNAEVRSTLSFQEYRYWIRTGAIAAVLGGRKPAEDETKLLLPAWAADRAAERSERFAAQIEGSGVRVVGDLALLERDVPDAGRRAPRSSTVPVEAAAKAVVGAISRGKLQRDKAQELLAEKSADSAADTLDATAPRLDQASGRELAAALVRRVRERIR